MFSLPFFLVIGTFFIFDPFKIIFDHGEDIFVEDGTPDGFTLNRDFVATEMFLKRRDSLSYDSFIFGSSRSTAFLSKDWSGLINNNIVPFHFIGSGESLFGIWSKVLFLKEVNHPIKNALFIVDFELLSQTKNGEGVIAIRHPKTSKQRANFYFTHLKEYLATDFFIQYIDFKFFGKKRPYMDKLFDNDVRGMQFDDYKNDWIHAGKIRRIQEDSLKYYARKKVFYDRPSEELEAEQVIGSDHTKMLEDIATVLEAYNSDFKIIINPLYNQKKLNKEDLEMLISIFGGNRVFDFSGKNSFTEFKGNYYESSHFKPTIGRKILNIIYKL